MSFLKNALKLISLAVFFPFFVVCAFIILLVVIFILDWALKKFLFKLTPQQEEKLEEFANGLVILRKWKLLRGSEFYESGELKKQKKIVKKLRQRCLKTGVNKYYLLVCQLESMAYM